MQACVHERKHTWLHAGTHVHKWLCIPSNGAPSTLAHMNLGDCAGVCHACEPAAWLHRALGDPWFAVYAHSPSHSLAILLQPDGKYLPKPLFIRPISSACCASIHQSHAQQRLHYMLLKQKHQPATHELVPRCPPCARWCVWPMYTAFLSVLQ